MPDALENVGELAFGEWFSINEITADGCANFTVDNNILYNKDKTEIYRASAAIAGDINIAEDVKTIKSGAFSSCAKIEHLYLPASLTSIETGAFSYCSGIKTIDFSEGLQTIGEGAFIFDSALTSISIPTTVREIAAQAFAYCEAVEKVIIPEGVTKIGENAFLYCTALKRVSIPKTVSEIGDGAFGYTVENSEPKLTDDFTMSVFSGSAGEKYAKSATIEYTTIDKSLKRTAFLVAAVAVIIVIIVFAASLMARGRKTATAGARKAEKEAKEKRLEVYTEKIQEKVLSRSSETIRQLVEERHRQKMTQQEIADITGIKPSNMARFESGGRVPTLVVLEKYANALGKHIEIKICDD